MITSAKRLLQQNLPKPDVSKRSKKPSLDHLVGAREERLRNRQTNCLCSLEVDDQLELCRVLHWQVAELGAPEYPVDVTCRLPELLSRVVAVRNQSTSLGMRSIWIDRWQPILCRQCDNEIAIREGYGVGGDDQATVGRGRERCDRTLDFSPLCTPRPTSSILSESAAASADFRYPMLGGSG